jgi:hypothetical protein
MRKASGTLVVGYATVGNRKQVYTCIHIRSVKISKEARMQILKATKSTELLICCRSAQKRKQGPQEPQDRLHGCNPTSPVLPTHTTVHRTAFELSSLGITSTTWPRLSGQIALNLKPPCELSRTRHGSRPRLTTRLAGFFKASRSNRRRSGTGGVGTGLDHS